MADRGVGRSYQGGKKVLPGVEEGRYVFMKFISAGKEGLSSVEEVQ